MQTLVAALLVWSAWGETGEERAVAHLVREVPTWFEENKCFSCHNNGDGARALFIAVRHGLAVPRESLRGTIEWLGDPGRWESNHGDPQFSDKKLSRLQFGAALAEAVRAGLADAPALAQAAGLIAADQLPDGSWPGDTGTPAGSPVTYNAAIATRSGMLVLQGAGGFPEPIRRAKRWLETLDPRSTPDAAAILMATGRKDCVTYLVTHQNKDGGWGPFPRSPSEVFDTAAAVLALRAPSPAAASRGRSFLLRTQLEAGGWPETTRPSGGRSYAQHLSTTAWALIALLETR